MTAAINPAIFWLLATPDWKPSEATPLAGFSNELCKSAFLLRAISFLPSDIFEPTLEWRPVMLARRASGLTPIHWYPQSPRAIKSQPVPVECPFTFVLIGPDQDPDEYREWAKASSIPPTLVAQKGGDISWDDLSFEGVRARLLAICDQLPATYDRTSIDLARNTIAAWAEAPRRRLSYRLGGHATITPNLMALVASGFESPVDHRFNKIDGGVQPYVDQIVLTTRSILAERAALPESPAADTFLRRPSLTLFAPAMFASVPSLAVNSSASPADRRSFQLAKNALLRQSGYGFAATTEAQMTAVFGFKADGTPDKAAAPHFLMYLRWRELTLATEAMGALAASEIGAVVRLPNDVNRSAGLVRQFAAHFRSNAKHGFRSAEAFSAVQRRIKEAVPPEFFNLIAEAKGEVRIVADAHLEWLDLDGLPLCVRRNTSRIPATPGNLFIEQLEPKPTIQLTPQDLRKVLVISALRRADPIRGLFELAFGTYAKHWKDSLNVTFVEVGSEEELVGALNAFDGALVIFDGHGSHPADQAAVLHLKDAACDIWTLRGRISRPPPIVILSACDTHAADRNHATTANGFLALGSRAVLASVFPLEALSAATFAARLIYRIDAFLAPAIGLFERAMTWTEVVGGMIRMQLLTDFLHQLQRKNLITGDQLVEVGQDGNYAINSASDDPFAEIVSKLAELGLEPEVLRRELRIAAATSSAISYLNMGRPETILVDTEERLKGVAEAVARLERSA